MGLDENELKAALRFIDWASDNYLLLRIDNELIVRAQKFIKKAPNSKTKYEFMHLLYELGITAVKDQGRGIVQVSWKQPVFMKSFNFLIKEHPNRPSEVKFKFTDSRRRLRALTYFLVWAAKQTPYQILPAVEFLELTTLCGSEHFTRAMTKRVLELLLLSEIKSIDSYATKLEVSLQKDIHHKEHKFKIGMLSRRIQPVEVDN